MEEAIFFTKISDLKKWSDRYSRVYFGNEFCPKLIPTKKELEEILNFVLYNNLRFTFVTGFVTDPGLNYLQDLLVIISHKIPDSEVVINDWGMLREVKKHNLIPVIGRLLTKQRRDPRILNLIKNLPQKAVECSKAAAIGSYLIHFLKNNAVERMEIDNLPQGIWLSEYIELNGFHISLYFPFNYVTTSRRCIFNNGCLRFERELSPKCERKCRHSAIILKHHTMPLPLCMKGNTIFVENRKISDYPIREAIDRIICQPDIPM